MAGSAQWMSSTTTTTGRSAASAEKKVRHAACISSRTRFGSSSASGVAGSSRPVVKAMAAVARSGSGAVFSSGHPDRADLLERDGGGVGVRDVGDAPQDLGQGPVRDAVAVRQAPPPHDQRSPFLRGGPPDELVGQPALADPRVAVDRDDVRPAFGGRALVHGAEQSELGVAAHHRPAEPHVGGFAGSTEHGRSHDRLGLALQGEVATLAEPESANRAAGPVGGQDLAGFGGGLQPGRGVDDVAGHHRLAGGRIPGRQHLAGVDADPHLQREPMGGVEFGVDRLEPSPHADRGSERPRRIVLVGRRHAERGHHGVADELLHRAALGLDLLAHAAEVGGHDVAKLLGVQPFAQRGRPGHVGEQHAHDPSFLGRDLDRFLDRGSTGGAEAGAGRQLHPAGGAHRTQARAARRAEPSLGVVLGTTCGAANHRPSLGPFRRLPP